MRNVGPMIEGSVGLIFVRKYRMEHFAQVKLALFFFLFSFFFFSFFIFIFLFLFFYPHPRLLSPFLARPPLRPMYDPCRYAAELSAERRCAQALIAPSYQIKLEDEYHFCHEFVVQFGTMSGPKKINK